MTLPKIQRSTSALGASEEINEFLDVFNLGRTKKQLLQKLEPVLRKKLKDGYLTSNMIYSIHQHYDWDWEAYQAKLGKGSTEKDYLLYAKSFKSELLKKVSDYPDATRFVKRNPMYSLIMANWIFNNHLINYGKRYLPINKSVVMYSGDADIGARVMCKTYEIMRFGGCDVDLIKDRTPIRPFGGEDIPHLNALRTYWDNNFLYLNASVMTPFDFSDLLNLVEHNDGNIFASVFPAIILANPRHRDINNRKLVLEFNCDD